MTVKHVSKSTNPTLGTYSKLHIKVCLEALKVDLMALKVTKGEGVLQYWPFPETCWRESQQFLVQYQRCVRMSNLAACTEWGTEE